MKTLIHVILSYNRIITINKAHEKEHQVLLNSFHHVPLIYKPSKRDILDENKARLALHKLESGSGTCIFFISQISGEFSRSRHTVWMVNHRLSKAKFLKHM